MIVNFIENGFMITSVEMDFLPDNEDRVVIFGNTYIVRDRIFYINTNKHLNIYVDCISNK